MSSIDGVAASSIRMTPDSRAHWRDPRPAVRSPVDGSARHCWRTGFRTRAASGLLPIGSGARPALRLLVTRGRRAWCDRRSLRFAQGLGLQRAQPLLVVTDAIRARSLLRRGRGRIRAGGPGRPTTNMIASIPSAIPAMIQVCTPRGRTPRGTGRRSVTAGAPAGTAGWLGGQVVSRPCLTVPAAQTRSVLSRAPDSPGRAPWVRRTCPVARRNSPATACRPSSRTEPGARPRPT